MPDVVLCDDHRIFADVLGVVLTRHGFTVAAVVHRTSDIVDVVARHRPDACVIDRSFADGDGLEIIPAVVAASPFTKVLMLTGDREPDTAERAMEAGARGYLCKTAGVSALVSVITRVVSGEVVVDVPPASRPYLGPDHAQAHRLAGHLTPRERECLAMIVEGLGSEAMAQRLGVATSTVRTYVQAVLTKLGVHSRVEAASFAIRHSLLAAAG